LADASITARSEQQETVAPNVHSTVSFSPYLFIFGDLTPILIFFYYLDIFFFIYLGIYLFIADSRCKHPFLCEPPGM
jgi:hypothetical protein